MKKLIEKLEFWQKSSNFAGEMNKIVRNSAKLLSANVVAQAIGLLVYPILTRLYSPDDFGVLNLFMSIGGVLVLLSTAEYQYAIVLPKEEKKARLVMAVCAMILVIVSGLVLLTLPFSRQIAGLFRAPALAQIYVFLPLYVLNAGFWNILNYWYLRKKEFNRISGYQVSQSVLSAGGKIGFGFVGWTGLGLPLGSVLAQTGALGLSISLGWKQLKSKELIERKDCRTVAKEYKNFPQFALPHSLANFVFSQLPVFILTPLFGTDKVGLWGMAFLLAFTPINVIAKSLNQVYYERITGWVNNGEPVFKRLIILLPWTLVIALPVFAGLYIVLPWLTSWLLGAQWEASGHLIRWMLPWVTVALLIAPVGCLKDIFFKQKTGLLFELACGVLRCVGIGIGIWQKDFMLAIGYYAIASAIVYATEYGWLLSLAKGKETKK